jgi:starvation-inducible outer membrane lipoprotein
MKTSIFQAVSFSLALTLAGCATRPESISASFVSHEKYMGQNCQQLTDQMADARAKLADFSKQQDSKANLDAATVFLVLIPASKLSGDHAGDVAKYKGEVEAIETAQIKTNCKKL